MKLPINDKPYYNTDNIANGIASGDMLDCYLEPVPGEGLITRRRPGLIEFADLGTGVKGDGIYDWEAADKVICVSGGRVFVLYEDGSTTEIIGVGEDESPPYTGLNHDYWSVGPGWQRPIKNESDDTPAQPYAEHNSLFETGALAKIADGEGTVSPIKPNPTLKGEEYTVVITPYVTAGSATYTLGGVQGSEIVGTETITDTITTVSNEALIITPTNESRMILRMAWYCKRAERDYPLSGNPVIFGDGQNTGGDPWLYMANGKLIYILKES